MTSQNSRVCTDDGPLKPYHIVAGNRFVITLGYGIIVVMGKCVKQPDGTFAHRVTHIEDNSGYHSPETLVALASQTLGSPELAEPLRAAFRKRTVWSYFRFDRLFLRRGR